MKRSLLALLFLCGCLSYPSQSASAQAVCVFRSDLVNHNRYAYDTSEECSFPHSVPFGNWGVSSNVGSKRDANQFQGWNKPCYELKVEWNSCSVDYVKPDYNCQRLNFPNPSNTAPYPANGYPYSDRFAHNNYVALVGGTDYCVDQYSPCGPNTHGGATVSMGVSNIVDYDGDGIGDAGGCMDLNNYEIQFLNNFMTVYELDPRDRDDVVESLYFPMVKATLRCTPEACFAVSDSNYDGTIDDIGDRASAEYKYPTMYQDNYDRISYATEPGVPYKRIDATLRVGTVSAYYSGPYPSSCDPFQEQDCYNQGGYWNSDLCYCEPRQDCTYDYCPLQARMGDADGISTPMTEVRADVASVEPSGEAAATDEQSFRKAVLEVNARTEYKQE